VTLEDEIKIKSKDISTDGYPMSIGELISLYEDGELDIHPEFQRFYRWNEFQRSKLIESILLGIPIPSIFVSQREDGVWDVIDGLQRLSTIFEFVGILKDDEGRNIEPSTLTETKYLPSLNGKKWHDPVSTENSLTQSQRLFIKRGKIDVKIIKKESDSAIKYELFQRLNTLGSKLSDQELRNCVLLMVNQGFFQWLDGLSQNNFFLNCIDLSEKDLLEKYDQEIVSRFLVLLNSSMTEIRKAGNFADFITDKLIEISAQPLDQRKQMEIKFGKTFEILSKTLENDSFRKYNVEKGRFEGRFLVSSFEALSIGIANNCHNWDLTTVNNAQLKEILTEKVISLWSNPDFTKKIGRGNKYDTRIPAVIPLGTELFRTI